jgi:hypothetical protein
MLPPLVDHPHPVVADPHRNPHLNQEGHGRLTDESERVETETAVGIARDVPTLDYAWAAVM